jgi:hypothetical protein
MVLALAVGVLGFGARAAAQPRATGVQSIVRDAEAEFRRQVNEYQARIRELDFSRRPNAAARKGMNDTIVNNHRSHLDAITRVRNESRTRISDMRGVPAAEKNNALRSLNNVYATEVRTLRGHEDDALRKLREAERR